MRFLILLCCFLVACGAVPSGSSYSSAPITAGGDTWVNGYFKKDGTYVDGYYRSRPNSTNTDNYSTQGNVNPYTGKSGTRARDYSLESQDYGAGKDIQTGPRGGRYYRNDSGKKVYVPKR
jgi:hypothetical protein